MTTAHDAVVNRYLTGTLRERRLVGTVKAKPQDGLHGELARAGWALHSCLNLGWAGSAQVV